jgi:hypothetical protein
VDARLRGRGVYEANGEGEHGAERLSGGLQRGRWVDGGCRLVEGERGRRPSGESFVRAVRPVLSCPSQLVRWTKDKKESSE